MNRFTMHPLRVMPLVLICLLAVAGPVLGGAPEEFAKIVTAINSGDELLQQGRDRDAFERYDHAEKALLQFRRVFPDWDEQVVAFRLKYVTERLSAWRQPGVKEVDLAELNTLRERLGYLERNNEQYQYQLNLLRGENARLSAKLREALAVRPAAQDPAEFARLQQTTDRLEDENAELRDKVTALETELAAIPSPEEARINAERLKAVEDNLRQSVADAAELRNLNTQLRERLEQRARSTPPPAAEPPELVAELDRLRAANSALLARVAELNSAPDVSAELPDTVQRELLALRARAETALEQNTRLRQQLGELQARSNSDTGAPGRMNAVDQVRLALSREDLATAEELLRGLVAETPDRAETRYLLGRTLLLKRAYAGAEAELKAALELAPNLGSAEVELSRLYSLREPANPALARWHYNRALSAGVPRDARLESAIGWE